MSDRLVDRERSLDMTTPTSMRASRRARPRHSGLQGGLQNLIFASNLRRSAPSAVATSHARSASTNSKLRIAAALCCSCCSFTACSASSPTTVASSTLNASHDCVEERNIRTCETCERIITAIGRRPSKQLERGALDRMACGLLVIATLRAHPGIEEAALSRTVRETEVLPREFRARRNDNDSIAKCFDLHDVVTRAALSQIEQQFGSCPDIERHY